MERERAGGRKRQEKQKLPRDSGQNPQKEQGQEGDQEMPQDPQEERVQDQEMPQNPQKEQGDEREFSCSRYSSGRQEPGQGCYGMPEVEPGEERSSGADLFGQPSFAEGILSVTAPWRSWKYELLDPQTDSPEVGSYNADLSDARVRSSDNLLEVEEEIAVEYPLTIKLNGVEFATLVCTPTHLEDLIVGFLASEGIIRTAGQLARLTFDDGKGIAYAEHVSPEAAFSAAEFVSKRVIGSCCGKSRQFYFANDVRTAKTVTSRTPITPGQIFALMDRLQRGSDDFRRTGGVHNAALCTTENVLAVRTDIGRHNALDKLYGHCLRYRIPTRDKAVAFSGRISSEVLLKTAKLGAGILLSKSAPTDLGLKLAHDLGITVVGFIRGRRLNVYTHPERISEA